MRHLGLSSEVTEWVSLVLAWPFRVGGTLRVGEALRVGFPRRRNGLSKGQEMRRPQPEGRGVGQGDSYTCPVKGPSHLPSLRFPRPLPG